MRCTASVVRTLAVMVLPCIAAAALAAEPVLTRSQALKALTHEQAPLRAAAIERLSQVGTMADADHVAGRLRDEDEDVRDLATSALWQIWSRSGDAAIDRRFAEGLRQMQAGELKAAESTFSSIVQRRPAFAEGWNKRATVRFMLGEDDASLKDCDEVLKRNPRHFGALSGMAQIHLRNGDPERALQAYERALQANPNLSNGPQTLQLLEQAARARRGERT